MQTKSSDFRNKKQYIACKQNVLRFFLNLYRIQTGVKNPDDAGCSHVAARGFGQDDIYELRLETRGERHVRRMTLGPLGDGSGSKSMCFKVIFDDIMVVKIPPVPIEDFDEYLENIRAERHIADKLSKEVECIIPETSAVLRKIPPFSELGSLPPDQLERRCINYLKKNPLAQEYLKIGRSFVFFMNLSKYSFLGHVLDKMHDSKASIFREITSQSDMWGNLLAFEEKYGDRHASAFFNIHETFSEYEAGVKRHLTRHGMAGGVPAYKIRDWFLLHLAGSGGADADEKLLGRPLVADLRACFAGISKKNAEDVKAYRNAVREYVHEKTFLQYKSQAAGIISNILNLLAKLKKRGAAIRDLKPDNVFVVGDAEKDPAFLARWGEYALGLIDFETAVHFNVISRRHLAQPMLAGTPSYATPSHLFENEILEQFYPDLARMFHIQDWQAAVAMIFRAAAGERLFDKSRKILADVGRTVNRTLLDGPRKADAFRDGSRLFWETAAKEVGKKLASRRAMLSSVNVMISTEAGDLLRMELLERRSEIADAIRELTDAQRFFRSEKSRVHLIRCSAEAMGRSRRNWEACRNVPRAAPVVRRRIIALLGRLEKLKEKSERRQAAVRKLDGEGASLTAYDLVELMFDIVLAVMYPGKMVAGGPAGRRDVPAPSEAADADGDLSEEETLMYESTLMA